VYICAGPVTPPHIVAELIAYTSKAFGAQFHRNRR
jgi:hypothetical protein